MRFVSYARGGVPGIGVMTESGLCGLEAGAEGYPGSLRGLLSRGADLAAVGAALAAAPTVDTAAIVFSPPIPRPSKILCVGLNYRAHGDETGLGAPAYPELFARFPSSLVGHRGAIVKPSVSDRLDYEAELAAVIGRRCRSASPSEALGFVAGYSAFNDASVRDYQMRTTQWTVGKNFDATGGFGPWLVTADELPPGADGLRVRARLNGTTMQDGDTGDMTFKVADLVAMLSEAMTLEPGDLIVTGTPAGVGFTRDPPVFMRPGDVCEVEVEGIGTLLNTVAAG